METSEFYKNRTNLLNFDEDVQNMLFEVTHLMQWIKDEDGDEACRFDLLIASLQHELLSNSDQFQWT